MRKPFINKWIKNNSLIYNISEIANSHQGNINTFLKSIKEHKTINCNAIKFQVFFNDELYLKKNFKNKIFEKLYFRKSEWEKIFNFTKKNLKIDLLCDVFGINSAELANRYCDGFKIHSTESKNYVLLEKLISFNKPIFFSVSGISLKEVDDIVNFFQRRNFKKLVISYGHQDYPTNIKNVNFNKLKFIKDKYKLKLCYADHSYYKGISHISSTFTMLGMGIKSFEKHFSLSNKFKIDSSSALEKKLLNQYFNEINELNKTLKSNYKVLNSSERQYKIDTQKICYASKNLKKGQSLCYDDIKFLRGNYKSDYFTDLTQIIGRKLKKKINKDTVINKKCLAKNNLVAILACRHESSRLKSKPFIKFDAEKIIDVIIKKLKQIKSIDNIVISIGSDSGCKKFINYSINNNLAYYLGENNKVLSRYINTIKYFGINDVIRITTDNPLVDLDNFKNIFKIYKKKKLDYISTKGLPDGAYFEIIKSRALEKVYSLKKYDNEYVTKTIVNDHKKLKFKLKLIKPAKNKNFPNIRLTVDNKEDVRLIKLIMKKLNKKLSDISLMEVINLYKKKPSLFKINLNNKTSRLF